MCCIATNNGRSVYFFSILFQSGYEVSVFALGMWNVVSPTLGRTKLLLCFTDYLPTQDDLAG